MAAVKVHADDDTLSISSENGDLFSQLSPSRQPSPSRQLDTETLLLSSLYALKSSNNYTLEDAYWNSRQRQMGISRTPKQQPVVNHEYQKLQDDQIQFIKAHFKQKDCCRFVPVPGQCGNGISCKVKELRCHCGEILSKHAGMRSQTKDGDIKNGFLIPKEYSSMFRSVEDILTEDLPELTRWLPSTGFAESETKAFGKIDFNVEQVGGKKPAKFIRLSSEDSPGDCLEMMQKFWHILEPDPPNLVISVVGGAKNLKLGGRNRSIFSTGLIKAAKTTKAWLITSGFNMGVMKAVGQAVHEGQTFQWNNDRMSHTIRCFGISPWGYVKNRLLLESEDNGKFIAQYRSSSLIEHNQPAPLNPDHTHFIFVDDGYRGRYDGVAHFRSAFEKQIAKNRNVGGLGIPVVLILVEGGIDAIKDVSASLSQEIPVVVCAGTGRAADILAYAYTHTKTTSNKQRKMSHKSKKNLEQKIAQAYKKDGAELVALTEEVIRSCQREDLMIIFDMKKDEEDFDVAILSVLLKAEINNSRESQLKLAMTWNRVDIAQEEIFREDAVWEEGSLENFLTMALVEDKVEFVKLLLNSGISMHEYLTGERLETLYNSIPEHSYLYQILKAATSSKSDRFTMQDIDYFLHTILDKYDEDEMAKEMKEPVLFKVPYKQLLIWAVLMNRSELAHLFLELGEEPICSALICTALCLGMEQKLPKYMSVIKNNFHEMKNDFESIAINVLDECHSRSPDKAIMLVEKKSPTWSNLTCLQIAVSAADQAFVSSVASQNSINNIWLNGVQSSWPMVLLCAFFPPAILWFIELSVMGKKVLSKTEKIFIFYSAPVTKFSLHTTAYVGFLILFTYMLSVDYKEVPSTTEWISIVWIFCFFVGRIHAFIVFPSPTFSGKLRDYFGVLEKLDFLNLILALSAFGVRWSHVSEGKIIYCINAVIFYITIMRFYTASGKLGPKLYMINQMLRELGIFVMVLGVFLLAYGVASQGLLYKHRDRSWATLRDIVYFSYWQLFGELFLEELETDEACTLALQASLNGSLTDVENKCRTFHWLVPVLLAMYLLIGNVLLLNLLIAIFSHVFETVEENGIVIWKFQMYFIVMEFQNQPLLAPPLSIILYLWHLIVWVYYKVSCKKRPKIEQFMKHHLEYLSLFEKEMLANKLLPENANSIYSLDMRLQALQTRIDELTKIIEDEVLSSIPHESNESRHELEDMIPKSRVKRKYDKKTTIENGKRGMTSSLPGMDEQNQ